MNREGTNMMRFDRMEERYLPQVLEIYNHYVVHTTVSFHTLPLTMDEIRANVLPANPLYCTYVCEEDGVIIGYGLLTQHKNKQAYNTTAEVTIYLAPEHLGKRIGAEMVALLESQAREREFHVLVATVCTENERSIRMFERLGYERAALFKEVGHKFGRWLDIASYQKILR
ncbi:GNAT family N-acetyltransferase [Paenibacillus sp. CF384]|uniref:GNAT family N-acetyltransferase n=1 Tax=Paenibacillus sp. CF384 TaxID=1884382 RepID=UPI00089922AD|nr:GNAT family N-acetyltransferase [Paenibacillus sp. CF384]SDX33096.1 phosphinothricin acetyltransferase [Paenibacillus sp. CF384]